MKFLLSIESNNEGPAENPEYFSADVLVSVAAQLRDGFTSGTIRDGGNGGAVGSWSLSRDEDTGPGGYPDRDPGHVHCGQYGHTDPGEGEI